MADKVPVKGGYNGGSLTGLAEYATGDTLGVAHGGTGVVTIGSNQLLTGNGTSALTSESNLTFDGTILKATGDLCATVKVVSPALCIGSEYVLPTADGSAGQIMCTNGSGALAFATAAAGVTLAGSTNNTIATVTGTDALAGEANLTFDGSTLTAAGNVSAYVVSLDSISSRTGTSIGVTLGDDADDDFAVDGTKLVVEGDTGNIGIGTAAPDTNLHVMVSDASMGSVAVEGAIVESNSSTAITIGSGATSEGMLHFGDSGAVNSGRIVYAHNENDMYFATAATERMRIKSNGQIRINTTDDYTQLEMGSTDANGSLRMLQSGNGTVIQAYGWCTNYGGTVQQNIVGVNYSSGAYSYGGLDNGGSNWHMKIRTDGNGYIDQTWHNGGADYAEYWESTDGTRLDVGKTVVLDGNKVRYYNAEIDTVDDIFGVTRPRTDEGGSAGVIGNAQWSYWKGRYKTDDFGRWIKGDRVRLEWEDSDNPNNDRLAAEGKYSYYEDEIPEGVTPPADAVRTVEQVRIPNDDFDPTLEYVSREDREEWQVIGLIGQIPILATETVNPKWKKQRAISDATDEYYVG